MKTSNILLLFALFFLWNCSRSYIKFESKPEDPVNLQLSKSFDLGNYTAFARVQKSENLYYKSTDRDSLQTEFQFIFLNKNNDSVIFISTIPARNLYDKSGIYMINHTAPNAHFFNHFYFGKLMNDEGRFDKKIEFKSRTESSKMEWNIQKSNDSIRLFSIDFYRTRAIKKDSLKNFFANTFNIKSNFGKDKKVIFKEIENYSGIGIAIVPDTIKVNKFQMVSRSKKLNTQYLTVNYNQKKEIQNIEIIFNHIFDKKFNAIRFKKNRILYTIE